MSKIELQPLPKQAMSPANNDLQKKFLDDIAAEIFPPRRQSETQKTCFLLRFAPENAPFEHIKIADLMAEKLDTDRDYHGSINSTIQELVKKISQKFAAEMLADGVPLERLTLNNNGRPTVIVADDKWSNSPWEIVYRWLWEYKFVRLGWQFAKEIASCANQELQMISNLHPDLDRKLDLDEIEDCEDKIEKGKRYKIKIDLQTDGYLLLINEDEAQEKSCICPSRAYYLQAKLDKNRALALPLADAPAKSLRFLETGEEYFLAIVTRQPLALSWVSPDADVRDFELSHERLQEIFLQLGKQGGCRVFYKRFEVV